MKIKNRVFDKDKLYFTSDTHFFHKNIITYCNRPYTNVLEMNEDIVNKWNEKIPKDAVVFHLGDFSLTANSKELDTLMNRLNGEIHLIVGNHEKDALGKSYIRDKFSTVSDIAEIFIKDEEITYKEQHIIMCHYPMITWNASHRGSWQLFGHVHGGLSNKGIIKHSPSQLDVGVDSHDFYPLSYEDIKKIITKQCLVNKK